MRIITIVQRIFHENSKLLSKLNNKEALGMMRLSFKLIKVRVRIRDRRSYFINRLYGLSNFIQLIQKLSFDFNFFPKTKGCKFLIKTFTHISMRFS